MKKSLLKFLILTINFQLLTISQINAQTGTWTKLTNLAPHENFGVMLLLTNGSVICHDTLDGYGRGWDRLTPDSTGSYVNGTWDTIASMNKDRNFFASQVLPSGKVWVAGGEYGAGDTASEVYDPATNTWTMAGGIPTTGGYDGYWNVFDAPSELLYNGTVLLGPEIGAVPSHDCLFYDPSVNEISVAPLAPYLHDEAAWIKLPDSSVLFIRTHGIYSTRYIPQTNSWLIDDTTPVEIYDTPGEESGCALNLPNGNAIFFGATQWNVIYTPTGHPTPGKWTQAADFPVINGTQVGQTDGPGAMMVNGHILLAVSPAGTVTNEFNPPIYFLEYDYVADTFTQVKSPIPGMGGDSIYQGGSSCEQIDLLNLPDGTVMMSYYLGGNTSQQYFIYTPGGGPIPQGKPTIDNITGNCPNFKITGKLFNGISEGQSFGDDIQNASNYPIIRLSNGSRVYYATSYNWNRIGAIQTDSLEDTSYFTVPPMPVGTYSVTLVANGFASNAALLTLSCSTLGIKPLVASNSISVYPNPNNGKFTIQLSGVSSQWSVVVYNILGKSVYSQYSITNAQYQIDLGSQPGGIYLYRVFTENGNLVGEGKFVKE